MEEITEMWKIEEGKKRKMTMEKQYLAISYVQDEVVIVLKK